MDSTECPPGLATDGIFQRTSSNCASSITAYWIVTMLIWLVRAACSVRKLQIWLRRRRKHRSRFASKRLPVPQIISFSATFIYLLMFILAGLNLANAENGISFSLFSLAFIPAMLDYVLMLLKLVKVGKKIIPLSLQVDALAVAERFDSFGLAMLFIQAFSLTGSCLALMVLSPIMPQEDYTLGVIGWSFKCTFLGFAALSLFYQYQRVINALVRFNETVAQTSLDQLEPTIEKNLAAIAVLRRRQFSPNFLLLVETTVLLGLLAGTVVPWTWEAVFGGVVASEVAGTFIYDFGLLRRRKPRDDRHLVAFESPKACENPIGIIHPTDEKGQVAGACIEENLSPSAKNSIKDDPIVTPVTSMS